MTREAEAEDLRRDALAAADAGHDAEALQLLQRVIDSDPTNAKAWINRSELLVDAREYGEAVVAARRAIELAPDQIWAWSQFGHALEAAGEQEAATDAFRRALEIDPADAVAWGDRTRLLFGRAAELEPNDPVHWNDLADAFEAVGEDEAAADARARAEELTSD